MLLIKKKVYFVNNFIPYHPKDHLDLATNEINHLIICIYMPWGQMQTWKELKVY